MMQVIGTIGFICAVLGGVAFWFVSVINLIRAVANRKEGVPLSAIWLYRGLFGPLLHPELLTDRGLAARRWIIYGIVGFFVCVVAGSVIGISTGVAH